MDKRVKNLWVNALLSNQFNQGKGYLRKDNKYCCLGVLCELFSQERQGHWEENKFITNNSEDTRYLPLDVSNWAGFTKIKNTTVYNPVPGNKVQDDSLFSKRTLSYSEMNDKGFSFREIANLIQENE